MLQEMPSALCQPHFAFVYAVHISVASGHEKFTRHQRRELRFRMCNIGPKIYKEQACSRSRTGAHVVKQSLVLRVVKHVHDISDNQRVVILRKRILEEISFDDADPTFQRSSAKL